MSNIRIFEEQDFRIAIRNQIKRLPRNGRGTYAKLAVELNVHTTSLSQIMAGKKPMSLEQGAIVCDFFCFSELEADYFLVLVQLDRAGNSRLRERLENQRDKIRAQGLELSVIVPSQYKLTLEHQAVFYSDWQFSAIRVLSSLEEFQTIDAISKRLNLSPQIVTEKVKFLVQCGLCLLVRGKLSPGPNYTHLESSSPFISKHHANWRLQAMQRHPNMAKDELAYSSLMTISRADAKKIRNLLSEIVKKANDLRASSECEVLRCICIDWITV